VDLVLRLLVLILQVCAEEGEQTALDISRSDPTIHYSEVVRCHQLLEVTRPQLAVDCLFEVIINEEVEQSCEQVPPGLLAASGWSPILHPCHQHRHSIFPEPPHQLLVLSQQRQQVRDTLQHSLPTIVMLAFQLLVPLYGFVLDGFSQCRQNSGKVAIDQFLAAVLSADCCDDAEEVAAELHCESFAIEEASVIQAFLFSVE
jgi:hypothetical protein